MFRDKIYNILVEDAAILVEALVELLRLTRLVEPQETAFPATRWSVFDRHVSPLADTIFRKSETSLWNWFYAIFQFSVAKNGVSAKELERTLGVTYKCAWRMAKQIRLLMEQDGDMLGGNGEPVEVDETYAPSRRHPRVMGRSKKQIIFGAVERDGRASIVHVRSSGSRVLLPEIDKRIAKGSHIHSDEWGAYKTLAKRGYSHTTVNHSKLEYVRGDAYTNTVEVSGAS